MQSPANKPIQRQSIDAAVHVAPLLFVITAASFFLYGWYVGATIPTVLVSALPMAALFAGVSFLAMKTFPRRIIESAECASQAHSELAAIVESCEDAIIGMTLDGEITSWNAGAETIYGYTAQEVLRCSVVLLNPPDRPNEIPELLRMVKQGKGINRYESERIRKDGRRLYVSASLSPIRDAAGNVIGASTIVRDITALKQVEENLRAHASQMETLYTVAQDVGATLSLSEVMQRSLRRVMAASGFDFAFLRFYDAAEQFRSCAASSLSDLPSEDFEAFRHLSEMTVERMPDRNQPWFIEDASAVSGIGAAYGAAGMKAVAVLPFPRSAQLHGVLTLMSPQVREYTVERAQFLQALTQQIGLAVENASLYSNTLEINGHLQEQIEERRRAEKRLADFTAMAVHDLRGPLSNMAAIAESLQTETFGPVNDDQRHWLGKVRTNCITLVDQITHFLDLSKMEAGHIELKKTPLDLRALLCDSTFQYSIQASKHDIELKLAIEPEVPAISADERAIRQVLDNLLTNALKFTHDGGRIEVGARQENPYQITAWVKDNGIGIPADELPLIFQKYRQLTNGKASAALGTGLGLAICKKIIEAHDGVLWAESQQIQGTTFFFSLPTELTDSAELSERQVAVF